MAAAVVAASIRITFLFRPRSAASSSAKEEKQSRVSTKYDALKTFLLKFNTLFGLHNLDRAYLLQLTAFGVID